MIKLVTPYSNSPSVEITKNPKVFFYDSGLHSLLWLKEFQKEIIGSVFETNIFSELVKKYGRRNVHYWRTKDRLEIDFVVLKNNTPLPLEVKLNFDRFDSNAMERFCNKYPVEHWGIVSLEGIKHTKNYLYPWEI